MLNPAHSVIELLGGPAVVREVTGTGYVAPYRWMSPADKGGTGGLIPQKYHRALLDYAKEKIIPLAPEHLIMGVPEDLLELARRANGAKEEQPAPPAEQAVPG